jgi:Restriction endonuclease
VDLPGKGSELPSRSIRRLAVEDIENLAHAESTISTLGASSPGRLAIHTSIIPGDVPGQIATMGCGGPGAAFEPAATRYIKLGENGKWATKALEQGIIPFGYRSVDHGSCVAGNWDEVRRQLVGMGRTVRGASQGLRELKEFYGLPDNTLWVTMADGHFWWAFAEDSVVGIEPGNSDEPARYRRTRGGWSKTSLIGEPLTVRSLSSALTRTASYQMTICAIKHADYLLRRIRDEPDPVHALATALRSEMREICLRMIRQLDWRDFETLVDLIFARGGWQRSSVLGKDQADVDLILRQSTIGETAWVQIKSGTSQAELDDYVGRFRRDGSCDRFFFVCHSPAGALSMPGQPRLHLWAAERLSDAAIDAGLFDWLIDRTR